MITKSGEGICNFCILKEEYRADLSEEEKTYFDVKILTKGGKLIQNYDKGYSCVSIQCSNKYQNRQKAIDP